MHACSAMHANASPESFRARDAERVRKMTRRTCPRPTSHSPHFATSYMLLFFPLPYSLRNANSILVGQASKKPRINTDRPQTFSGETVPRPVSSKQVPALRNSRGIPYLGLGQILALLQELFFSLHHPRDPSFQLTWLSSETEPPNLLFFRPATTSARICRCATNCTSPEPSTRLLPAHRRISNRLGGHPRPTRARLLVTTGSQLVPTRRSPTRIRVQSSLSINPG